LTNIGSKSNLFTTAKNIFSSKKFSLKSGNKASTTSGRQVSPTADNDTEEQKESKNKNVSSPTNSN